MGYDAGKKTLGRKRHVLTDTKGLLLGLVVRALIKSRGASLLYLPPYSPDFNPIENAFAKLKALLRREAPAPLTRFGLRSVGLSTSLRQRSAKP